MANIYLNEFDRFMVHQLKPLAYIRYGDDWLCFGSSKASLESFRKESTLFLKQELFLLINPKLNYLRPAYKGISYLGVDIWSHGRRLQPKVRQRVRQRLNTHNAASYRALVSVHEKNKKLKEFDWYTLEDAVR